MTVEQMIEHSKVKPIILFDGVCNLCNGFVNFVINHDKEGIVQFCALQDNGGVAIRQHLNLGDELTTAVGLWNGHIYTHSDVLGMIARSLGGFWKLVLPFYVLPKSFRDTVYNWVARNRYHWFGKSDKCRIPTPDEIHRFIGN